MLVALVLVLSSCSSDSAETAETASQPDPTEAAVDDTEDSAAPAEAPEVEPTEAPAPEPTDPPPADPADEPIDDQPDEADTSDISPTDAIPVDETIDWTMCGLVTQCGTVAVPADYDDPAAGTLDIAVNIRRTSNFEDRVGYLFVNPGGPGFSGQETVTDAEFYFDEELLDRFDLVGFDPRGVAASEPAFACGTGTAHAELLFSIDTIPDTPEEVAIGNEAVQMCVDSMGAVGMRVHSAFVARDMDEIREALGAEQISYLGFSYGSSLGGWYASIFPERVYSMAVDGATNPAAEADTIDEQMDELRRTVGPIHTQLEEALLSCNDTCPIWNDGDPLGYWYSMADKFALVRDDNGGNNNAAFLGFIGFLYNEAAWPALHDATFALGQNDDPSKFSDAIVSAGTAPGGANITEHINCLDRWALFPGETLESQLDELVAASEAAEVVLADEFPLIDAIDLPEQGSACVFYESFDPPVFEGTFDGGGIPILVIGNTTDPVTPYSRSEEYANDVLADGRLVQVEHTSHVVYPSNACVVDLVHSALIDQDYPDDEVTCADAGLGATNMIAFDLPDGSSSLRPEGWEELAPGVFAKGNPATDPLLAFSPTGGDTEDALAFVEEQYGVPLEAAGEAELNGVVWQVYELENEQAGVAVRLGISPGDNGVMILIQAPPGDLEAATSKVLLPAVDGFTWPG